MDNNIEEGLIREMDELITLLASNKKERDEATKAQIEKLLDEVIADINEYKKQLGMR